MSFTPWKWIPLKVVEHTLISSDKRVSIKECFFIKKMSV